MASNLETNNNNNNDPTTTANATTPMVTPSESSLPIITVSYSGKHTYQDAKAIVSIKPTILFNNARATPLADAVKLDAAQPLQGPFAGIFGSDNVQYVKSILNQNSTRLRLRVLNGDLKNYQFNTNDPNHQNACKMYHNMMIAWSGTIRKLFNDHTNTSIALITDANSYDTYLPCCHSIKSMPTPKDFILHYVSCISTQTSGVKCRLCESVNVNVANKEHGFHYNSNQHINSIFRVLDYDFKNNRMQMRDVRALNNYILVRPFLYTNLSLHADKLTRRACIQMLAEHYLNPSESTPYYKILEKIYRMSRSDIFIPCDECESVTSVISNMSLRMMIDGQETVCECGSMQAKTCTRQQLAQLLQEIKDKSSNRNSVKNREALNALFSTLKGITLEEDIKMDTAFILISQEPSPPTPPTSTPHTDGTQNKKNDKHPSSLFLSDKQQHHDAMSSESDNGHDNNTSARKGQNIKKKGVKRISNGILPTESKEHETNKIRKQQKKIDPNYNNNNVMMADYEFDDTNGEPSSVDSGSIGVT